MRHAPKLDELYDREVRPLSLRERLELAERIIGDAAVDAGVEAPHRSLLELEGLGAELWEGVDAQEYVARLRDEWDERR